MFHTPAHKYTGPSKPAQIVIDKPVSRPLSHMSDDQILTTAFCEPKDSTAYRLAQAERGYRGI